ncbi:hypothetical protein [Desulfosporosinus sp. OT]|uniref:hypothetical protein n=1 Tax=Desulfosporosinus sp. OT TaxID=913865 RepID=UPI000590A7E8|nr:hypothetical protein [Desulfosporosinus sp. OT]
MYDTVLGAYDAEQTNRSSSFSGERGSSYAGKYSFRDRGFGDTNPTPVGIPLGITASAIVSTGDYRHWRLSCQKRHPLACEDTVFARISLLAGWPSVPEAHENTVFARITLLTVTVFARINLLAGRREGTVAHWRQRTSLCSAPCFGSVA